MYIYIPIVPSNITAIKVNTTIKLIISLIGNSIIQHP